MQSLSYVIVNNQNMLKPVFNTLSLVGYLPDYRPKEEELPKAYIVMLVDNKIARTPNHDAGIAAMSDKSSEELVFLYLQVCFPSKSAKGFINMP